ncbi:MAG TPA: diguanylate cyclase [Solirubrobacteraceae bacterium]|nr:diguanylate cyclase [Solirubrobacteraceae bacterium]
MRILVVDDSAAYRRVLAAEVSRLGHECLVATDGESAWELFTREGADAVISNWLMPGLDGDELCRRVRSSDQPYAYFILFTARDGKRNMMRGMQAGADDYLGKPLDRDELEIRLIAAERVTRLHRELAAQQRQLEDLNRDLYEQSRHDVLTGVANRLRMEEDLRAAEANAVRSGDGYAIALFDVDHFKAYNDTHGHPAGDVLLRTIAAALRDACRAGDTVYRYGGEELLVLLPDQGLAQATALAERMRTAVAALGIEQPAGEPRSVMTISAGVAAREPGDDEGVAAVLARADAALYRAKERGRDRVEVAVGAGA